MQYLLKITGIASERDINCDPLLHWNPLLSTMLNTCSIFALNPYVGLKMGWAIQNLKVNLNEYPKVIESPISKQFGNLLVEANGGPGLQTRDALEMMSFDLVRSG